MMRLSFEDNCRAENLNAVYRMIFAQLPEKNGVWEDFRRALEQRRAQGDFYLGDGLLLPHCWWPGKPQFMFLRLARPLAWGTEAVSHIIFFCLEPDDQAEMRQVLEICFREKGLAMFLQAEGDVFQAFLQTELKKGGIDYEI